LLTLTNPEQVVIKGSEPIAATKVIIEAENLEMVQPNLQSQVEFKKANVTLTGQATTTFGGNVTAGTITTQGISVILLTGQSISTSIQGDSLQKIVFSKDNQNISGTFNATNEIIFSGSEQNFSGTFNATQVTMDGTGKKYLVYDTTINGSMTIAEGVTLQPSYHRTLTVNGEIINQGTIQNSRYYLYLHTSGNLTNNGT